MHFGLGGRAWRTSLTAAALVLAAGWTGANAAPEAAATRTASWIHYASQGNLTEGQTRLYDTPLLLSIERDGARLADVRVVLGGRRIAVPRSAYADLRDVDLSSAQVSYGTCCGRASAAPGNTDADDDYLHFGIRLALRGTARPARYVQFQFARGSYAGRYTHDIDTRP